MNIMSNISKKITPEEMLAKLKKQELNNIDGDEIIQKDEERKTEIIEEVENFEEPIRPKSRKPTKEQLKDWYNHIRHLEVEVYVIESHTTPRCQYCEAWKADVFEQKYIFRLHELLGLDESQVKVHIYKCDWNCLHATQYEDENGEIQNYPMEIDDMGENYYVAYGMGIGFYPALILRLDSEKMHPTDEKEKKRGASHLDPDYEEIIFQGVASKVKKMRKYLFNKKAYFEETIKLEISLIRAILRYLRTLDESVVEHHDKVSLLLGQYHRQTSDLI
jgi:hypothetical protein